LAISHQRVERGGAAAAWPLAARAIAATALVLASISPDIVASQARAQVQPQLQNSLIEIAYVQPNDRGYQAIYDLLKKRQVLSIPRGDQARIHHGGVSLWPCSSRRQETRHGRHSSLAIGFVPTP
jgi:hypothetical protein